MSTEDAQEARANAAIVHNLISNVKDLRNNEEGRVTKQIALDLVSTSGSPSPRIPVAVLGRKLGVTRRTVLASQLRMKARDRTTAWIYRGRKTRKDRLKGMSIFRKLWSLESISRSTVGSRNSVTVYSKSDPNGPLEKCKYFKRVLPRFVFV